MSNVKKSIVTAVCMALCVVLPLAFHAVPNAGSVFCPMHIPVLLCGLVCGWPFGLACGLVGPFLSAVLTGMPPMAYLPGMLCELAVYGMAAGLLSALVRTGKFYLDMYIALIVAMLLGRVIAGILKALIFSAGQYSLAAWATGYFVTSLPGVLIQLALLPSVVLALERAGLVPRRYKRLSGNAA